MKHFPILALSACLFATTASAADWPQWRGPDGSGVVADNPNLPEKWSAAENIAWKTPIPGLGWSGPIVTDGRVLVTSVTSDEDFEQPQKGLYLPFGRQEPPAGTHHWKVLCLDLDTGNVLWEREAHTGRPPTPRHPKNSYAAETPATDGERIYALFGDVGLFAYTLDGEPVWSQKIEPRATPYGWGPAASPIVHDGQVIVLYDNEEASFIASFDAETGKEIWRNARDEKTTWATPFIWENKLRTEIVTSGRQKIRSYDLNGNLLWELRGEMSTLTIPTPIAGHGMVYISSGYIGDRHRPAYAIRPGASGDITPNNESRTNAYVAWYDPKAGAYNPSAILYGDIFYTLLDGGFLTAHDAKTGKEIYGRQRIEVGATFTASPLAYNGKLFLLSEDGNTYVVESGKEYTLLHKNPLNELTLASPAVADDKLLIRTAAHVYCIRR